MKEDAVSDAVASRTEVMEFHTKMMRLDLSPLDKMSLDELTEIKGGVDLRLRAAQTSSKLLAEMAGYNAAQKHDHVSSDRSMSPAGKTLDDFYKEAGE